jgi:hypothetical protein
MVARDSFPIARTSDDDDMLAIMAHAMGCATLAHPSPQPAAASAGASRLTADRGVTLHTAATLRVLR